VGTNLNATGILCGNHLKRIKFILKLCLLIKWKLKKNLHCRKPRKLRRVEVPPPHHGTRPAHILHVRLADVQEQAIVNWSSTRCRPGFAARGQVSGEPACSEISVRKKILLGPCVSARCVVWLTVWAIWLKPAVLVTCYVTIAEINLFWWNFSTTYCSSFWLLWRGACWAKIGLLVRTSMLQFSAGCFLTVFGEWAVSFLQLCQAKGHVCGFCDREQDIIFPHQQGTTSCPKCGACYHSKCYIADRCLRCRRIAMR